MIFSTAIFSLTQALQLVGLVPSLFLVGFLLIMLLRDRQALVPALYFVALACGFAHALAGLVISDVWVSAALMLGSNMLVAFSFLLIIQLIAGRVPPPAYWLVLGIPLFYALGIAPNVHCTTGESCLAPADMRSLYNIISASFVLLLLVYYSSRPVGVSGDDIHRRHKYWLVISLILLHLCVLAADLARLAGRISPEQAEFTTVIFELTFIYLVLTSLFRVFNPTMARYAVQMAEIATGPRYDPEADKPHIEKLKTLLDVERVWAEMRLNRAALAKKVGINEHHLSRVINGYFGKNFNEVVNGYRIEEAKRRLKSEPTAVTTIAFEAGFNSIASFNRVFKEKVGLSPTEFRNVKST